MAIGIAVDILGCTGNLEERVATLNRIIQVAVELKDSMGDLYAFSAVMKALEMPQVKWKSYARICGIMNISRKTNNMQTNKINCCQGPLDLPLRISLFATPSWQLNIY